MPIRLDERLSAVASLVSGGVIADIGCDHGKLGYYLIGCERAEKVIACDISPASLKKADELAKANGADLLIETRLGNGLDVIADRETDTVVIAGLGGDTIADILARGRAESKRFKSFVLSPNTHPEKVRSELEKYCHKIVADIMVKAGGKYYTVIKSEEGAAKPLDKMKLKFGAFYESSEQFKKFAEEELLKTRELLREHPGTEAIKEKAALLEAALGGKK